MRALLGQKKTPRFNEDVRAKIIYLASFLQQIKNILRE